MDWIWSEQPPVKMELGQSTNIEDRVVGLFATKPVRPSVSFAHPSPNCLSNSIRPALCPQPRHVRQSTGSRAPENGKSVSCDRSPEGAGSSHASREREPG